MATTQRADETNAITLASWTHALDQHAADLDLADSEDRAVFRSRVQHAAASVKVSVIRTIAEGMGSSDVARDRSGALRALTTAYITKAAH